MADFILELYSEEIPAMLQKSAGNTLARLFAEALGAHNVHSQTLKNYASAQRLTLLAHDIPLKTEAISEEKKGPRCDAPEKAINGFLRANGLDDVSVLDKKEDAKGAFYVYRKTIAPRDMVEIITEIVPQIITTFPWPKTMRWGAGQLRWIRPLRGILCRLNGDIVPFTVGGLTSGGTSYGHRFLSPAKIDISHADDYLKTLEQAYVIADAAKRETLIAQDAQDIAVKNGLELIMDKALIEETAGLVEWPVPILGKIDDAFMQLPPEVLQTAMRTHQKYFALRDSDTKTLAPYFITISNMVTDDAGAAIRAGNERVLRARLADARFFWEQDQKTPLADYVPKLASVIFHAKLGTVLDKTQRMQKLAEKIAPYFNAPPAQAARAAYLCKADLTSAMVYEFPELQGVMGGYYAQASGEDDAIARAIATHYAPLGPSEKIADTALGQIVALADKIDTLAGFWLIGETPTGSKDPYALRRAALGIVRIIAETHTPIGLRALLSTALSLYKQETQTNEVEQDLFVFIIDRLKIYLRDKDIRHDIITAIFAQGDDDILSLIQKAQALTAFLQSVDGENLLAAYRRAVGICKKITATDAAIDPTLFNAEEEKALYHALTTDELDKEQSAAVYHDNLQKLSHLRAPIDAFFDHVIVNDARDDIRQNRLNLLQKFISLINQFGDMTHIEG